MDDDFTSAHGDVVESKEDDEYLPDAQDDYYASTDEYDFGDPEALEWDDYSTTSDKNDIRDREVQVCGVLSTEESDTGGEIDNSVTHTVSFKCIGITRDKSIQKLLEYISENLSVEETPVRLNPEPTNPYDNKAIDRPLKLMLMGNFRGLAMSLKKY